MRGTDSHFRRPWDKLYYHDLRLSNELGHQERSDVANAVLRMYWFDVVSLQSSATTLDGRTSGKEESVELVIPGIVLHEFAPSSHA